MWFSAKGSALFWILLFNKGFSSVFEFSIEVNVRLCFGIRFPTKVSGLIWSSLFNKGLGSVFELN